MTVAQDRLIGRIVRGLSARRQSVSAAVPSSVEIARFDTASLSWSSTRLPIGLPPWA
jgi:hypothetical protein